MAKRAAFYLSKEEIESFFEITSDRDNLFEANYNITPGQHIPVVFSDNNGLQIKRLRWGKKPGAGGIIHKTKVSAEAGDIEKRAVLPLSGFYVWKDNVEKGHPFFVRMMDNPLLCVPVLVYKDESFKMIVAESNVLVQPMTDEMPMLLDRELSFKWLDESAEMDEVLKNGAQHFQLTDLSVTRVSKKVNNPKNNGPDLIQPIPK